MKNRFLNHLCQLRHVSVSNCFFVLTMLLSFPVLKASPTVDIVTCNFEELLTDNKIKAFYDTLTATEQEGLKNLHCQTKQIVDEAFSKLMKLTEDNSSIIEKIKSYSKSSITAKISIDFSPDISTQVESQSQSTKI